MANCPKMMVVLKITISSNVGRMMIGTGGMTPTLQTFGRTNIECGYFVVRRRKRERVHDNRLVGD